MFKSINKNPRFLKHLVNTCQFTKANSPFFLVDVGAANGIHSMWDVFGTELKGVGFEPDNTSYKIIPHSDYVTYANIGLGSQNKQSSFYLSAHPQNSGAFPPNVDFLNRMLSA